MAEIELLEHVLGNLKADRPAGYGLLLNGETSTAKSVFGMGLYGGYKIAPRTHMVNGFEVPAPETEAPDNGHKYWVVDFSEENMSFEYEWDESQTDEILLANEVVFLSKQSAIANAKAMRGIDPYTEEGK